MHFFVVVVVVKDGEIDAFELQAILNSAFKKGKLIFMKIIDISNTVDFKIFKVLFTKHFF